uniref:Uncharacterized protein n=1 Tax=Arundo donax TaxID=35708 RepID=A0A0A9EAB2_ARUDO
MQISLHDSLVNILYFLIIPSNKVKKSIQSTLLVNLILLLPAKAA